MKSHDYEALLTRLLEILKRLYEGQSLSVVELAREFGVSDRTIQRDFNERMIHFPLHKEGRRWKLKRGYASQRLEAWEDQLVLEILKTLAQNSGPVFGARVKRLLARLEKRVNEPFFTPLALEEIGPLTAVIGVLENAIAERRAVRFFLKTGTHTQSTTTQPLKIVNLEGRWLLAGLDAATKVIKYYPLAQIDNPALMVDSFKPDKSLLKALDNALSTRFDPAAKPFTVTLKADAPLAERLKSSPLLPTQKILREHKDGSIEFSAQITHEMEILPLIGYFLGALQILTPITLKETLKQRLTGL